MLNKKITTNVIRFAFRFAFRVAATICLNVTFSTVFTHPIFNYENNTININQNTYIINNYYSKKETKTKPENYVVHTKQNTPTQ